MISAEKFPLAWRLFSFFSLWIILEFGSRFLWVSAKEGGQICCTYIYIYTYVYICVSGVCESNCLCKMFADVCTSDVRDHADIFLNLPKQN